MLFDLAMAACHRVPDPETLGHKNNVLKQGSQQILSFFCEP